MIRTRGMLLLLAAFFLGVTGFYVVVNTPVVEVSALPQAIVTTPVNAVPPAKKSCLNSETPFYFANVPTLAKEGPRSFGPPMTVQKVDNLDPRSGMYTAPFKQITATPTRTGDELYARLCGRTLRSGPTVRPVHGGDKALYLAYAALVDGKNPNRTISDKEWHDGLRYLIEEGIQFDRIRTARLNQAPHGFTTYMEPNDDPTKQPRIGVAKFTHWDSYVDYIPIKKRDGSVITVMSRDNCGAQLMFLSPGKMPTVYRQML